MAVLGSDPSCSRFLPIFKASDVAHTMQHWHVYRKWNELLFEELYKAYKDGRSDTDPSKHWYEGEIGFFDYYSKCVCVPY
jgi:hypothetical protein